MGAGVAASAARRFAPVQLDLAGKNPAVVFDCEDLEAAAREIVSAAFLCTGQRCIALSRVIVADWQADALVEKIVCQVGRTKVGDGLLEGTTMGPLVCRAQFDIVDRYVRKGIESGCPVLAGGAPPARDPHAEGFYYTPTVFDRVPPDSPLASEEIFGPVLPVIRVKEVGEAIEIANANRYGPAAAVFTSRQRLVHKFASKLQAGMIHINHGTASQAHVPFGGRKDSGQGAFSIGPSARDFYTQVKAVYVKW